MTPKLDLTLAAANPKQPARKSVRAGAGFAAALLAKMPAADKTDAQDKRMMPKLETRLDRFDARRLADKDDDAEAPSADASMRKDDEATNQASALLDFIARQFDRDERRSAKTDNEAIAGDAAVAASEGEAAPTDGDAKGMASIGSRMPAGAQGHEERKSAMQPVTAETSAQPAEQGREKIALEARPEPTNTATPAQEPRAAQKAADAAPAARSASDMPSPGGLAASVQVGTQPQSAPAQTVTTALGADPIWASYFRDMPSAAPQPVKSLRIQLNPAELGVVTAHLKTGGDTVTVELEVETADARDHLSSDADSIVKSLKAVGVDVDKVTVKLVDHGAQTADRGDAQSSRGFAGEAGPGSNRERQSNGSAAREFLDGAPIPETGSGTRAEQGSDGRYI